MILYHGEDQVNTCRVEVTKIFVNPWMCNFFFINYQIVLKRLGLSRGYVRCFRLGILPSFQKLKKNIQGVPFKTKKVISSFGRTGSNKT